MTPTVERPENGIWPELLLGPGRRRILWGIVLAVGGTAALTPMVVDREATVGVLVVPVVAAALVGRLWAAVAGAAAGFVLSVVFVSGPPGSYVPTGYDYLVLALLLTVGVVVAVEEAARARAGEVQERLAFLAQANRVLTTSLDVDRTLTELTRLAVPRLADWCAVQLLGPDGEVLTRRVAHVDPERVRLVEDLWERSRHLPDDPGSPLATVLASGRPVVLPRVTERLLHRVARDPEHLRILRHLQLRSAILMPLRGPQGTIGVLMLVHAESGRRYSDADLAFVEELAQTTSMAMENARLHRDRSRIAQTLQNSLLPPELPEIPGVEVAVRYRPAGEGNLVGGDFYDLFDIGRGSWAVALGDVCGKGPEAAAITGLVRHSIRTAAAREPMPSDVLSHVNRQILGADGGRFCTVTLGTVQPSNGHAAVTVSCGGHPAPLVFRPGKAVEAAECAGTLLGVFAEPELADTAVRLGAGDAIVFYTDGVTERFERQGAAGDARLAALLWECGGMDASGIADLIYREAALASPGVPRDDIAIVVLRVPS